MPLEPLEPYHHPIGSISSCAHSRPKQCKLARPKRVYRGGIICNDLPARRTALVPRKLERECVPHHLYRARRHTRHQAQALTLLPTQVAAANDASELLFNTCTPSPVNNRVAHRTQPHHAPGLSPGARSAPARRSQRSAAQPRTRGSLTKSDTAVTLRIPDSPRKSEVTALARLILGAQHVSAIISTTSFYFGGDY